MPPARKIPSPKKVNQGGVCGSSGSRPACSSLMGGVIGASEAVVNSTTWQACTSPAGSRIPVGGRTRTRAGTEPVRPHSAVDALTPLLFSGLTFSVPSFRVYAATRLPSVSAQQHRYRVIERLAAGGMAEVFRAESAGLEG